MKNIQVKYNTFYSNNLNCHKINFIKLIKKHRSDYDPSIDYYKVLNISQAADDKEIKAAYFKLAKQYHPDLSGGNADKFKEINSAYEVLSDKDKKLQYDASRKFNSFWSGKSYQQQTYNNTSNQNTYSYNNRGFGGFGYNQGSRGEDPFKGFNDWFKGFNQQSRNSQNYKSNFSSGKKDNFSKKYYQKNKDYFSSFKDKEENYEGSQTTRNKSEPIFGKKYYEKNKKYYESFKTKSNNQENYYQNQNHNQNQNYYTDDGYYRNQNQNQNQYQNQNQNFQGSGMGQVGLFIFSLFGVILGSMIIRRVLYGSPHSHPHREIAPQYNKPTTYNNSNDNYRPPAYNSNNSNESYRPSSAYNNISFDRNDKQKGIEVEHGVRDDPFNRK